MPLWMRCTLTKREKAMADSVFPNLIAKTGKLNKRGLVAQIINEFRDRGEELDKDKVMLIAESRAKHAGFESKFGKWSYRDGLTYANKKSGKAKIVRPVAVPKAVMADTFCARMMAANALLERCDGSLDNAIDILRGVHFVKGE